jgi:hypothetical protein
VRGRRFVRPTLTLNHKGAEVRALADLEHKPWAAEDGEVWMAAFTVDEGLDAAREIELSVAPDIAVELRRKGRKLARPGDTLAVGTGTRAPRFKRERERLARLDAPDKPSAPPTTAAATAPEPPAELPPSPRRRPSTSAELERLGARLASANHALEQERERRAALAKTVEDERTTSRQLRTELGQARVELEVVATLRAEAAAMEAELDDARRKLREAERRHEADTQALTRRHQEATEVLTRHHDEATQALSGDHEQVTQAHASLQAELQENAAALESTREALATERAEAGRLRNRLAQLQEARQPDATPAAAGAAETSRASRATETSRASRASRASGGAEAAEAGEVAEPRVSRRSRSRAATQRREPDPTETQSFDVLGFHEEFETETAGRAGAGASRQAPRRATHQASNPAAWNPPVADRLRPVNPSLRHRTWWFGRLLALLVLCGVIAAVWIVLHSTVLH